MSSRLLAAMAAALFALAAAPAQTAAVTHYGSACPSGTGTLSTQGLPRPGTSLTVQGVSLAMGCTLRACICTCCLCNNCRGPSFLLLGAGSSNTPVVLPGLTGNGCTILVTQDAVMFGTGNGDIVLQIPNNPGLIGVSFYLQRADTLWQTTLGSSCTTTTLMLSGVALSDGVQCLIGT